jgi:hypothetical protein
VQVEADAQLTTPQSMTSAGDDVLAWLTDETLPEANPMSGGGQL